MKRIFPILGILFALAAVLFAHPHLLKVLWQPSAMCIVLGATLGVTVAQSTSLDLYTAAQMFKWLWAPPTALRQNMPQQVYEWAKIAKKEGNLYFEKLSKSQTDIFLKNAFLLLADNPKGPVVKESLKATISATLKRYKDAIKVIESAAGYAPTIGIIGSVLGLLSALSTGASIEESYSDIGLSFVSTFYGLTLANLILYPIANRLKAIVANMVISQEILAEGFQLLADNKPAVAVRDCMQKAMEDHNVFV